MTDTRISSDSCRQVKKLQQMTGVGRFMLDVPGPGANLPYVADPQIQLQKWGANTWSDATDVHSYLLGITVPLSRHCSPAVPPSRQNPSYSYPTLSEALTTEQSRAILPAWTVRETPQCYTYYLFHNPQNYTEIPFQTNLDTRNVEREQFITNRPPCLNR